MRENITFRERQNSGNSINVQNQQFEPVVMESSSMFPNNAELSNEGGTNERKRREGYQESQYNYQNDPKPSSKEENLENLIHLKRALIKHDQTEVPGKSIIKNSKNK